MQLAKRLSHALTHTLSENNLIPSEEFNLYQYCFEYILDFTFNCTAFLIIALICNEFWTGLLFTTLFLFLRSIGGGVHAPTEWMCNISSFAIYLLSLWLIPKATEYDYWICPALYAVDLIIICLLCPVDHANKRFDETQKQQARKRIYCLSIVMSILYFILYLAKLILYYRTMTICVTIVAVSMLLGTFINYTEGRFHHDTEHHYL